MNLIETSICFLSSFVLTILIFPALYSQSVQSDDLKKNNFEKEAEKIVQLLDHAINEISSLEKRTLIRTSLVNAYYQKFVAEDDARTRNEKVITCMDDALNCSKKLGSCKTDIGSCKTDLGSCKTDCGFCQKDLVSLNKSMCDCEKDLKKLSIRNWMERVERNTFPPWLLFSNMDRYERWLFAAYFVEGINMINIRSRWKAMFGAPENMTYESVAGAMFGIYERVSDCIAHGESDKVRKPENIVEINEVCSILSQGELDKTIACDSILSIHLDYSQLACGLGETYKYSIMYGRILECGEINAAKQSFEQLFVGGTDGSLSDINEDISSCNITLHTIHNSQNKYANKQKKKDSLAFSALCSNIITPEMFKSYVLDGKTELKRSPVNTNIKQSHLSNKQAKMEIYIDDRNPPRYITTTTDPN